MPNDKYRGAIIGLGFIGGADQVSGDVLGQRVEDLDGTHLHAMLNHPRVELVAGSSRDAGRRERFVTRTSARAYADWREMLEKEQLDIVSIATYAPQHAEMTVVCAERGIAAIYCEKPIATNLIDAERMLAACNKSNSLLVINHNRRFHPTYRRLRDHVAADSIGELTSVSIQWGSGRLGNVGTHMFNTVLMLTGRRVEAVSATLDLSCRPDCRGSDFADPGGWGLLRMEQGLMATFDAPDFGVTPPSIALNGTKGRAIAGAAEITFEYWNGENDAWSTSVKDGGSMDRAMEEIVAHLDGNLKCEDRPENSFHTLETIVACHASHHHNSAWVELPLSGPDREIVVQSG